METFTMSNVVSLHSRFSVSTPLSRIRKIVTHNGVFHADEVFAIAALRCFGVEVPVVRTRNREVLEEAINDEQTIVVDIGGVFDPDKLNFDHHHREFNTLRPDSDYKYSSFGLVWNFLLSQYMADTIQDGVGGDVAKAIDQAIVFGIDLADNGNNILKDTISSELGEVTSSFDPENLLPPEEAESCENAMSHLADSISRKIYNPAYSMTSMIASFRPTDSDNKDAWNMDLAFEAALNISEVILTRLIKTQIDVTLNQYYLHKVCSRKEQIVILDRYVPHWENIVTKHPDPVYIVYPDVSGQWRCQCVPFGKGDFGKRKALPEKWAALSDVDFQLETGVEDAVFCHNARFICGAQSKEGTLELARLALIA